MPDAERPTPNLVMTNATAPSRKDLSERALGALMLAPAALLLLVIVVYPIATLLWNSLHTVDPENAAAGETFVWLENYARAFDDERFWHSTWNTVLYIVVTVPASLLVGLGLALLANRPFAVKWPVRLGLLLPWALPLVFAGLIFRWFFEYQTGIVNDVLVRLSGEPLQWLSSPTLATVAVCIAIVWKSSSFMALMLLAGLQSIPRSLYEAAEVDGASTWQQFVEITLPMLRPAIFVALIFRTITAIQTFDIPYAMTGGGPGEATETLAMYIHKTTLDFLDFGYGSALAALMFLFSMGATSGYLRYTRRSSGKGEQ
jgi:multiple sugar transport system permease protein